MGKRIGYFIEKLLEVERWDGAKLANESKEVFYFIRKQVFNQIPSVSAIAGLSAGAWVASTFTTSPIKGTLASWGIIKGGTHVISTRAYGFISLFLPVIAAGIAAYAVQKGLKLYRENQLKMNKAKVSGLEKKMQAELRGKLDILEQAKVAGLISENEYRTKEANLYQAYARANSFKLGEMIINKIAN